MCSSVGYKSEAALLSRCVLDSISHIRVIKQIGWKPRLLLERTDLFSGCTATEWLNPEVQSSAEKALPPRNHRALF